MATNNTLIEIEGLTKIFYTDEIETHALSGIHLTISKGEYVAMSGPSGCGKSTLLSIIGLLDTPTDGKYLLNKRLPLSATATTPSRTFSPTGYCGRLSTRGATPAKC